MARSDATARRGRRWHRAEAGFSLIELAIALALTGLLGVVALSGFRAMVDASALATAARVTRDHVQRARAVAIYRRGSVRVRELTPGELWLLDDQDSALAVLSLTGPEAARVDSLRVRPASLRFNSRGQAAPGSIYLYRGRRGVRLVVNFLGRIRVERVVTP